METKSILKSKTIWFNLIVGILTIVGAANPATLATLLAVLPISSTTALTLAGFVVSGVNMWLRSNTTQGLHITPPTQSN